MRNLVKEPLFHFLAIGLALFLLFAVAGDFGGERDDAIVVSEAQLERLVTTFERQWRRPPTQDELTGLVEALIREEVLYREALRLGLERDDTIIRRRLAQKMEFLSEDLASSIQPDEEALRKFFAEHPERYEDPLRVSFTHIYFNEDARNDAAGDARVVLAELQEAEVSPGRAPELGDRFMLQYDYPDKSEAEIGRHFGGEFAAAVMALEEPGWHGPLRSGYGLHLVHLQGRQPASMPAFEEVRERVVSDFEVDLRERANDAFYEGLRRRYRIEIEEEWLRERIAARRSAEGGNS